MTAVKYPLIKPAIYPTAAPVSMANTGGMPALVSMTEITPDSASVDPTERSIPPVRITKVIPAARIAVMEDCFRIFRILWTSVK
ncbi:hypothetical protein D3C81_1772610 [compost metagenome]